MIGMIMVNTKIIMSIHSGVLVAYAQPVGSVSGWPPVYFLGQRLEPGTDRMVTADAWTSPSIQAFFSPGGIL